jgi:sigma-B regulation protein RsbU (phosphoserine phosphatase)
VLTTAFYLVADAATGRMRYANAGHPKPLRLHRAAGQVESLKSAVKKSQPALGLFEHAPYHSSEVLLVPRDLLMLFTDGLYEVHAPDDKLYTHEMLAAAARRHLHAPAPQLFDSLLREVSEYAADHAFEDDVCLVGMEYCGVPKLKPA